MPNFSTTPDRGGGRCCRWGPPEPGNSPYTSESTFAGNPLLIDLEDLRDRGLLTEAELSAARVPEGAPIDYAALL